MGDTTLDIGPGEKICIAAGSCPGMVVAVEVGLGLGVRVGPALLMGAHGGIAGGSNLRPDLYVGLYRAATEGRIADMQCLGRKVMEISEKIYRIGDPATSYFRGLKCALGLEGICSELPAPPLVPLSDAERSSIRKALSGDLAKQ